ncbi:SDR family oxidoreductase [Nonomuraea sp. NPDC049504]|uniref:SDR family oxidoreductase n=1 Tax=Nonomuraea sp. NPDC049504 TaxID=3154729 RepID=UPI00342A0DBA
MIILVTGAGGPTGAAVSAHFRNGGHTVIEVGRKDCDLLDRAAVNELAARVEREHGHVDGVVHLVGGWRGAPSFTETSLDDWNDLHDLLVRTLQHVSLAFEPLLRRSANGRFVIVSARAAQAPEAGGAAYAAAKAAAEAWTLSLADALRGTGSAAVILVVKALANAAMRAAKPEARFAGFTDVDDLAAAIGGLYDRPAEEINGTRLDLTS